MKLSKIRQIELWENHLVFLQKNKFKNRDRIQHCVTVLKSLKTKTMQKELEEIKESLYIMVSTRNQMVNYIPYKYFDFDQVWNITTDDDKNKKWDKYYQNVGNTRIDKKIEFQYTEILKIAAIEKRIKRELKSISNNKIFWNITGGQRPFVLAIHNLIKSDELKDKIHYLCYLEGNKREMQIMKFKDGVLSDEVTNSYSYQIEGLTID